MWRDQDGKFWLFGHYRIEARGRRDISIRVDRAEQGYVVHKARNFVNFYEPRQYPPGHEGETFDDLIPVFKVLKK